MPQPPLLEMRGISKAFAGVPALSGVNFTLQASEVHALVGENGAGKSTLMKVLTGALRRDAGAVFLGGKPAEFRSPRESLAAGVAAVYQEPSLLRGRTVAQNLMLGREPTRWGMIDRGKLEAAAREGLARLGLSIPADAVLGELSPAEQQLVAIARAASAGARVLILDEPTSALAAAQVETLFAVVGRLRSQGVGTVFISHRFDELYALCDRVTVLRDGRVVTCSPMEGLRRIDLICSMLGKTPDELENRHQPVSPPERREAPLLQVTGLRRGRRPDGVTLQVAAGEVVGLAGLLGSGRSETVRVIFGLDRPDAGEVLVRGRPLPPGPRRAIAAGLALLPEDRKTEGIFPDLSVRDNLTVAALPLLSRLGIVSPARQREVVDRFARRLRIKMTSPAQKIRELSGGNQQKVLLARWLCRSPALLLLDEPTRGVDVGAQAEISALVGELAAQGMGVLLISSELEELLGSSSRVVVLRDGRSVAELSGDDVSEHRVVEAMAGEATP